MENIESVPDLLGLLGFQPHTKEKLAFKEDIQARPLSVYNNSIFILITEIDASFFWADLTFL